MKASARIGTVAAGVAAVIFVGAYFSVRVAAQSIPAIDPPPPDPPVDGVEVAFCAASSAAICAWSPFTFAKGDAMRAALSVLRALSAAARVCGPNPPRGGMPWALWNFCTAALVRRPK
jgi:hypothetical protein